MKYTLHEETKPSQGVEEIGPYRHSFPTPLFVFAMQDSKLVQPAYPFCGEYGLFYGEHSNFTTVSC